MDNFTNTVATVQVPVVINARLDTELYETVEAMHEQGTLVGQEWSKLFPQAQFFKEILGAQMHELALSRVKPAHKSNVKEEKTDGAPEIITNANCLIVKSQNLPANIDANDEREFRRAWAKLTAMERPMYSFSGFVNMGMEYDP